MFHPLYLCLIRYHWITNQTSRSNILKLYMIDYMSQNHLHPARSGEEGSISITDRDSEVTKSAKILGVSDNLGTSKSINLKPGLTIMSLCTIFRCRGNQFHGSRKIMHLWGLFIYQQPLFRIINVFFIAISIIYINKIKGLK